LTGGGLLCQAAPAHAPTPGSRSPLPLHRSARPPAPDLCAPFNRPRWRIAARPVSLRRASGIDRAVRRPSCRLARPARGGRPRRRWHARAPGG